MGTVVLKMSDYEFWNCTHKKLIAMIEVHNEYMEQMYGNSDNKLSKKETKEEYIDNIL